MAVERNQIQCTLSYTKTHEDWLTLSDLAAKNLTAKPGGIARLLLGERLRLYRAGWKPDDLAMLTRLETIVRLKEEHLEAFDEFIRGLALKQGVRKSRKAAGGE